MSESVIGIDMESVFQDPAVANAVKESPLEGALAQVTPADAAAATATEAKFEFRSLLSSEQRSALEKNAPSKAAVMVKDYNEIIRFGAPILEKLNKGTVDMLNEQRNIEVPEIDHLVSNLLRQIDGYEARYRNDRLEGFVAKIKKAFSGTKYSIKAMIRDAQPITKQLDEAEVKLHSTELDLAENVTRSRKLHDMTIVTMKEVVAVLAAFEEIRDVIRKDFEEADAKLREVGDQELASIEWKGELLDVAAFREVHHDLSQALSEVEKSWFDWRQQFFLGYASAPSLRNLGMVSAAMQRRLQVFRTQGIPSARKGIAMWQVAALARRGAEMGKNVREGTDRLVQGAFKATSDAVGVVAQEAQQTVLSDETVFVIIDSVKAQVQGILDADRLGREHRARNLQALEQGEAAIKTTMTDSRRQLVANSLASTSRADLEAGPAIPNGDILADLGVTK